MIAAFEDSVFINCPFDQDYAPIFRAVVFCVHDAGFVARCALEVSDGTQDRLSRITRIVAECKYGLFIGRSSATSHASAVSWVLTRTI